MNILNKWKDSLSKSPINYYLLRFKDSSVTNKFLHYNRNATYERAKFYIVQLSVLACLSLFCLLVDSHAFALLFGGYMATILSIALCLLAGRWRLNAVDFILPCTILSRGLTARYITRMLKDHECVSFLSDILLDHLNPTLFIADLIAFRTCVYSSFYVSIPLCYALSTVNKRTRFHIMQEFKLSICLNTKATTFASFALFFTMFIPLLVAIYLVAVNELWLF